MLFLGEETGYWIELQKRVDTLDLNLMIRDLAIANAKVRYYEQQIERMYQYRTGVESLK